MARQQRNSTATQMVVAMGVLMVPIAIIVAFFTYNPPPTIQQVDYLPVALPRSSIVRQPRDG